ncbi:MAG: HAD-IIIA family hydrolase [Caldilineae bacterium]|nr:HAD-IIIA family hydrolase [Caldilineae bacterium]
MPDPMPAEGASAPNASEASRFGSRPAVFLDRDGVLVRDRRHGAEPALMRLLPGTRPALAALAASGYALVVVSNQSGLARGLFTADEARAMGLRLAALLAPAGIPLAGYWLAPNHPDGRVAGLDHDGAPRKPSPALLRQAAAALGLDLGRSWMLGDRPSDVEAGAAAGARPILIDIGSLAWPEAAALPAALRADGAILARNLPHAVRIVLSADGHLPADREGRGLPWASLVRAARPPDGRGPGEPSRWPDGARMRRAAAEGRRLARALGRGDWSDARG